MTAPYTRTRIADDLSLKHKHSYYSLTKQGWEQEGLYIKAMQIEFLPHRRVAAWIIGK